ncbi:Ig-like domain-containing protein [Mumia flava]|uniref:Amine oxidase n=1 Tax=Mumia flava TaxID=1348852 RepID=A0A2M9BJY0_9ACTN|nr:Ig-like domain repeat protein [Mumia flava]PJJ58212.1 Ig-like domain-containing protein [Mumia flava]
MSPRALLRTLARATAALAATALAAGLLVALPSAPASAATPDLSCSSKGAIRKTLEAGSAWAMCFNINSNKGLVLEEIWFKGANESRYRKVLDSIALSQLNVPYDSGVNQWNDITGFGFGNQHLQKLAASECPGGTRRTVEQAFDLRGSFVQRSIPAVCVNEQDTGLAYRSHEQENQSIEDGILFTDQGTDLVVSTISKVDWYEYEVQYRFTDTGSIVPQLGATGDLSPIDFVNDARFGWNVGLDHTHDTSTSHHHNAVWRVDFGLDGATNQTVEQYDYAQAGSGAAGPRLAASTTTVSTEATKQAPDYRWFRVVAPGSLNADGHARSYEIAFGANDVHGEVVGSAADPSAQNAVTFSQARACEQYASENLTSPCTNQSVLDYANGQSLTDPVAWVNVGFHHVVRDEDQSPMPVHWQGFTLLPRDFTAISPITPLGRECVNGRPDRFLDSSDLCGNATRTTVSRSATGQIYGTRAPVSLSIKVRPVDNDETPTGTANVLDGKRIVATGIKLNANGNATYRLPSGLAAGRHNLKAVYSPKSGSDWVTSKSSAIAVDVRKATSYARLSVSPTRVERGRKVTYAIRVSAPGGSPTGTLRLKIGSTTVKTRALKGYHHGRRTLKVRVNKRPGGRTAKVVYEGNRNLKRSVATDRIRVLPR